MITPYRAEQVGSLLRPAELLQARAAHAEGRLSLEDLRRKEDEAIASALDKQRQIGIDILTDGEMRRGSWLTDMADAVEGFVADRVIIDWKGPRGGPEYSSALAAGARLKPMRRLTAHELPMMKSRASGPFKVTLPAPSNFLLCSYKDGLTDQFYSTRAAFLAELVQIVRTEVQWLASQGAPYIQLDGPYYAFYLDADRRDQMRASGRDPDMELKQAIEGDSLAISAGRSGGAMLAFHLCRGNSRNRWFAEGGYDDIAERLFGLMDVDAFLLEYDSDRAGGFEPLRFVPPGKNVVLGLVTTKEPQLEPIDDLRRRIDEAARYVPLENLALSPQCGFASVAAGNFISIDDQWRKLERIVDTARRVWG